MSCLPLMHEKITQVRECPHLTCIRILAVFSIRIQICNLKKILVFLSFMLNKILVNPKSLVTILVIHPYCIHSYRSVCFTFSIFTSFSTHMLWCNYRRVQCWVRKADSWRAINELPRTQHYAQPYCETRKSCTSQSETKRHN